MALFTALIRLCCQVPAGSVPCNAAVGRLDDGLRRADARPQRTRCHRGGAACHALAGHGRPGVAGAGQSGDERQQCRSTSPMACLTTTYPNPNPDSFWQCPAHARAARVHAHLGYADVPSIELTCYGLAAVVASVPPHLPVPSAGYRNHACRGRRHPGSSAEAAGRLARAPGRCAVLH